MNSQNDHNVAESDVREVLNAMGGVWETQQNHDHYVAATRADGLILGFHHAWNVPAGKVRVSLNVPSAHVRYSETTPSVNVTLTRGAATVARDLNKRFMPDAETLQGVVVERLAAHDAYVARVDANRVRLEAALGRPLDSDRARIRVGEAYGEIYVMDGHANLTLNNLTIETAEAILVLLNSN